MPSLLLEADMTPAQHAAWSSLSALVDELGVAAAIYGPDASELHRSRQLAALLASELAPDALLDAARELVRAAFTARLATGPSLSIPTATGTSTAEGATSHYRLRAVLVPPAVPEDGAVVLVEFERAGLRLPSADELMANCRLTRREVDIALLLAAGATDQQIARRLALSPHTVRKHAEHIFDKLHVHSRRALVLHLAALAWPRPGTSRETR